MLPLRQYLNFGSSKTVNLNFGKTAFKQIHPFPHNGDNFWNIIYKINTMLNTNLVYISKVYQEMGEFEAAILS